MGRRFKVGDRVRITDKYPIPETRGSVVTITAVDHTIGGPEYPYSDSEGRWLSEEEVSPEYENPQFEEAVTFVTKDSGQRESYETGAVRDTQEGKPRYDLIPATALKRIAGLYARGAEKYSEWNWTKGISKQRCLASAMRHLYQFILGDRDEDHLAAVCFNVMAIMHYEEMKRTDLDDLYNYKA